MALIKEYMTPKGLASYWVVSLIQIDNFSETAYVRMYGFANKNHADMQNPVPLLMLDANITTDIFPYYFAKEILEMANVTPQIQAYQIFKDFNIKDEQGQIFNFNDAINEIGEVENG